jgi:hypothetical protein
MTTKKPPPKWPSDDQVREPEGEVFTDDGRKRQESDRVGGLAPDSDPEPQRPRRGGSRA